MTDSEKIELLCKALKECTDDLANWIHDNYGATLRYPSEKRRYDRDMEIVIQARTLLEKIHEDH